MNEALSLGLFQFDNLIRNRVPFVLFRTEVSIEAAYGVMEKMHLRNFSVVLKPLGLELAEKALEERHARLQDPIVVLDEDGTESKKLADELAKKGYQNVYFVLGGWEALESEIKAGTI